MAAAPLPQFKRKDQPPGTEKRRGPGQPPKKKSDPGYVKVLSFAGKDKQVANAAIAPRGNKGQVDKDLYIESVGEFADDLIYESESDGNDEVDPVEGEDTTAGEAEAQGDQIHEVISVQNSETLSFANLMLELVAAPPVAGTSAAGTDAVNDEIKAFEQEYKTFEREYEAYIETMVKNPPKAESTQCSYKSWLARWKAFCLKSYKDADMPFEVEEYKVHVFFKDVVFTRTTTKTFHDMSCKTKKVLVDRLKVGSRQPTYLQPASDQHWRNSDQGQTGAEETAANVMQRVVDMEMFVMARKAITYLHVRQISQLKTGSRKRNPFPLITGSAVIKTLFDSYKQTLVYGQFGSGQDPAANCILRNSYDRTQHLRMLADTWQSIDNPAPLLALREHFVITVRHAMLL
ncbi:hypothetical protein CPC16_004066 [Podila verticillata]|nr:hypothetical protein CPC16_004066 [Podila verticillata]